MKFPWRKSSIDDPTSREGMTNLDISTITTTSVEEAEPGCCNLFLQSCVNVLHLGQLIAGLVLFGYGIVIALPHFRSNDINNPSTHHNATIIIMIWSCILVISSTTGVFSLASPKCNRIGLIISAYAATILAIWNIIVASVLLIGIQHLINYLQIHEKALYLSYGEIHHLEEYRFWYGLLFVLVALLEIWRYEYILYQFTHTSTKYVDTSVFIFPKTTRSFAVIYLDIIHYPRYAKVYLDTMKQEDLKQK